MVHTLLRQLKAKILIAHVATVGWNYNWQKRGKLGLPKAIAAKRVATTEKYNCFPLFFDKIDDCCVLLWS